MLLLQFSLTNLLQLSTNVGDHKISTKFEYQQKGLGN